MEALNRYLNILATQAQHDAEVMSSAWMYTGFLLVLYVVFTAFKWYVLLMPLTLPITLWGCFRSETQKNWRNN